MIEAIDAAALLLVLAVLHEPEFRFVNLSGEMRHLQGQFGGREGASPSN